MKNVGYRWWSVVICAEECLLSTQTVAIAALTGGHLFSALYIGRITNTVTSKGIDPGMMATQGKGRRTNVATNPSATATTMSIDIILAAHFTFSRLIFIVVSV